MEIYEKETKVLVFRKGHKNKRLPQKWQIGDKMIAEAKSYKYLGITVKDNRLFNEHVSLIKEKGNKAFYSLIAKNKEWQGFNPKTFLHVFDHTIVPILNYGAEIWGNVEWEELEKIHLSACKYILGVSVSTPTDGVYAELSLYTVKSLLLNI